MAMVNQRLPEKNDAVRFDQTALAKLELANGNTEAGRPNVSRSDCLHTGWLSRLNKGVSSFVFHFVMFEQGFRQVSSFKGFRKKLTKGTL
jgi:hypothetical protein